MRRVAILIAVLALAACGPTVQERTEALQRYVGQPEAMVVQQFGVPDRVYEAGGIKFLAYEQRRLGFAPGIYGAAPYGPYGGFAYGYAAFPPPQVERICDTTFEVATGIIRRVTLRGTCGN